MKMKRRWFPRLLCTGSVKISGYIQQYQSTRAVASPIPRFYNLIVDWNLLANCSYPARIAALSMFEEVWFRFSFLHDCSYFTKNCLYVHSSMLGVRCQCMVSYKHTRMVVRRACQWQWELYCALWIKRARALSGTTLIPPTLRRRQLNRRIPLR